MIMHAIMTEAIYNSDLAQMHLCKCNICLLLKLLTSSSIATMWIPVNEILQMLADQLYMCANK